MHNVRQIAKDTWYIGVNDNKTHRFENLHPLPEGVTYNSEGKPAIATKMGISDKYRGKRLVRKVVTKYDSTIDKYVNV